MVSHTLQNLHSKCVILFPLNEEICVLPYKLTQQETKKKQSIPVEVSGLDARFECPICLLCLKDPILTSCGHRFCGACIELWLKKKNARCPVDNTPLQQRDLFPDNYTRREILTHRIQCSICSGEYSLSEIDEHMTSHSAEKKCPFYNVGCDVEIMPGELKEHLEKEIHHHMQLLQSKVQLTGPKGDEAQFWESGKGKEGEDSLLKSLYERTIVLEQRVHEQDGQIQKYRRDVLAMEKRFELLELRHCFGEYLWRIENFREKIEASRENKVFYFSPGFYTSPAGYKVCARVNVASHNPNYLSLLIHLMQSDNDVSLPWPFSGTINLAVVHPTQSAKSILDTMSANPESEAFSRPLREINIKAFGFVEYAHLSTLLDTDDFLDNDALIVKILVQSASS